MRHQLIVGVVLLGVIGTGLLADEKKPVGSERWEPTIARFEAQDEQHPPTRGGILFVGSSSIVRWDLEKWFPDLPALNRGFGGSMISDSIHFAERIVVPYRPKTIVFYAGDNDIAKGKTPAVVLADYKTFVGKVHKQLPGAKIVYVAIKPSLSRWKLVGAMREANQMIREVTLGDKRLEFVDIDTPMLGADGRPREELFVKDGLHLSEEGYKLWTGLVMPHLKP